MPEVLETNASEMAASTAKLSEKLNTVSADALKAADKLKASKAALVKSKEEKVAVNPNCCWQIVVFCHFDSTLSSMPTNVLLSLLCWVVSFDFIPLKSPFRF
jgi:hypothetical protein